MAITKIEHVGIMVTDMKKSVEFYQEALNLKLTGTLTLDNGVEISFLGFSETSETLVELVQIENSDFPDDGRVHHLCFTATELEAEIERLTLLGITFVDEEINTLPNKNRNIFFYGPDRERIELLELA